MRLLQHWMGTAAAHALGLTLAHFLWEGAAIAAVLAVALWLLRSSRARYAAACAALAAMPLACAVTFLRVMPQQGHRLAPIPLPLAPAAPAVAATARPPFDPSALVPYLVPLWLTGVLLLDARTLAAWAAARRLRRIGVCAAPATWQHRLAVLASSLHLVKPVALLESCRVDVPLVAGYLRPVILVPLDLLSGMPPGQVEAILLHELAHIRRRDYLVNLLQAATENLLFYHPAVWWVSGVIRAEREHCCDDLAVGVRGNARDYAAALTALETRRGPAEPALAATGGNLVQRIRRILDRPEPRHTALTPALAAGLVVITAAALAAWPTSAQPPETPYGKWLTQDVAYIITDQERAAFKALQTDEEREHFIEQFWLRRDPTPGTVENEFKEEHYRRIAYANSRFTTPSGLPGWKTDQGRIYIVYGPPDEIESHPSGDTTHNFPYVQWLYRYIEGIGNNVIIEFDDTNRTGDFRMTADSSVARASLWIDTVKRGPMNRRVRALGILGENGTVQAFVSVSRVREVAVGQAAVIDTRATLQNARVTRIGADAGDGTTAVTLQLDSPTSAAAGTRVDATIDIEIIADAVYVGRPVSADANTDSSIFKIEPDGQHAVRVPVRFGRTSVNQIEIVSGLLPGDRVILSDMSVYANYDRIGLK